jgi:hypothetical protein
LKDDGIAVIENIEILNSILISKLNPKAEEILKAFKTINKTAESK